MSKTYNCFLQKSVLRRVGHREKVGRYLATELSAYQVLSDFCLSLAYNFIFLIDLQEEANSHRQ